MASGAAEALALSLPKNETTSFPPTKKTKDVAAACSRAASVFYPLFPKKRKAIRLLAYLEVQASMSCPSPASPQLQGSFSRTLTKNSGSDAEVLEVLTYEGEGLQDPPGSSSVWSLLRFQHWAPASSRSLRSCSRKPIHGQTLHYEATEQTSALRGAFRCSSSFCASCGKSKTARMASRLQGALAANMERGGQAYFLTLTIPSDGSLSEQYGLLSKAYRKFSKALLKRVKEGGAERAGVSWSFDCTYRGAGAKPHLHLHLVLFLSSPVELVEEEVFQLWERQVQLVAGRKVYLSKKAFYVRPVRSHEATAKYVFKHLKSSLELANSKGKSCGFWSLLERASKGDQAAIKAHTDTLVAFFNRSWSHLGKFASELAGPEEEEPGGSEGEGSEDVLTVEVPPLVHGLVLDAALIDLVFDVMKASSSDFRRRESFRTAWSSFLQVHEGIKDRSFELQLLFVKGCLPDLLGSLWSHDLGLDLPEIPLGPPLSS